PLHYGRAPAAEPYQTMTNGVPQSPTIVDMMLRLFRPIAALAALLSPLAGLAQIKVAGDGGPGPARAMHLSAELVTLAPRIAVGGQLQAGLRLVMEEGWHVYWVNAGFAGGPPHV